MKRRLILMLTLLTLLLSAAPACAGVLTMAELRAQAPQSVQFTIDGETYDVPVVLPQEDHLPILMCQSQLFDWDAVKDKSVLPDPKHVGGAPLLISCSKESKKNLFYCKTFVTSRYPLPMGSTPPENDFSLEQAMALIMDYNGQFCGDPNVDLRVHNTAAMSGLCKMKSGKSTAVSTGVSVRMPVADPKKPVKGREKGAWDIELCQYMHGARILSEHRNYTNKVTQGRYAYGYPIRNRIRIMDEENFFLSMSYLKQGEVVLVDAPLASWETVERSIRELITQGKIRSLYRIELGYDALLHEADNSAMLALGVDDMKAYDEAQMQLRHVLVPTWELTGYCVTDYNEKVFAASELPTREAVLSNLIGTSHAR